MSIAIKGKGLQHFKEAANEATLTLTLPPPRGREMVFKVLTDSVGHVFPLVQARDLSHFQKCSIIISPPLRGGDKGEGDFDFI